MIQWYKYIQIIQSCISYIHSYTYMCVNVQISSVSYIFLHNMSLISPVILVVKCGCHQNFQKKNIPTLQGPQPPVGPKPAISLRHRIFRVKIAKKGDSCWRLQPEVTRENHNFAKNSKLHTPKKSGDFGVLEGHFLVDTIFETSWAQVILGPGFITRQQHPV